MKKSLLAVVMVVIFNVLLFAQSGFVWRVISPPGAPTASGSSIWYSTSATGTSFASLSWTPVGTFSGCTVQVDYSNDGTTVAGQLITAQTCTTTGSFISGSSSTPAYVRVTYTLTGGTYLKYVAMGCTNGTCTTSSGGSVTGITAGTGITVTPSPTSPTVAVTNPAIPTAWEPLTGDNNGTSSSSSGTYIDVSKVPGATMDVQIRAAIASMSANSSAVLDASAINGNQSFTTSNPFIDLVGQGYAPSKTGVLKLCNVKITTQFPVVVPSGWHIAGCGKVFAGSSGVQIVAGVSFITTTTGTASNTAASGSPFISVVTGTGFTAAMEGALYVTCLNTTDLSCVSGTAGSSAYGNIHFVNSTTLNIWTPSTATGNANTSVSYVIYGCIVCMGDTSSVAGGGNQNFDVEISGMVLDTSGKAGAVPFLNWNCSNLCSAWDLGLRASNNDALDIQGSATQNSGPYYRLWLTATSCTSANAVGVIIRSTGSSTIFSLHDFSIAMGGCGTGAQYDILLDAQAHIGPAIHIVTGSNTLSEGVVLGKGNTIACPVACPQPAGSIKGAFVEDVNMTGTALNIVDVGTNQSPINYAIVKIVGDPSSSITNTLTDNNRSPVCNLSNTAEPQLIRYEGETTGLWHSSSQQTNCLSNDGVNGATTPVSTAGLGTNALGQIVQAGTVNAQSATYQVLASDFQLGKTLSFSGSTAVTLTLVASGTQPANGQFIHIVNFGTGAITITRSGQNLNGGTATVPLSAATAANPNGAYITSDGTNYEASLWGNVSTSQATLTSGGLVAGAGTNKVQVASANATVSATGQISATEFASIGTTFTAAGCSNSTLLGGASAGSYHSGTTGTCTVVITTGFTATNGWACKGNDLTTPADSQNQTATTTTTATLSGTTVTGDVVNFFCMAY